MLVTPRNFATAMERLSKASTLYADTETTGLLPHAGDHIIGVSLLPDNQHQTPVYFPVRHAPGGNIEDSQYQHLLDLVRTKRTIFWNMDFDYRMFLREGVELQRSLCAMIGLHLVDENRGVYGLQPTSVQMYGEGADAADRELRELLIANLLPDKASMYKLRPDQVERYACDDVVYMAKITEDYVLPRLIHEDTLGVWRGVCEYGHVIARAKHAGIKIDLDRVSLLSTECYHRCLELANTAREWRGRRINLDSPQQVAKWLNVPSTDKNILELLGGREAALVREYRDWAKANSTYYRVFQKMHVDSVIHCNLSMIGTVVGRLSCSQPNLQSLPRETDRYKVKHAIVARPGRVLLQADYSKAELCLGSHYGREANMARILRSGGDPHQGVADETGLSRSDAKRINFSVIYGIGAWSLSRQLRCSEEEAQERLDRYHLRYPGFRRLYQDMEAQARKKRFIRMWTGRRRHYNKGPHLTPYHKASSNLVQGGIGELLRIKQTELDRELRKEGVTQLLQVHDSAVMEVPEEDAPRLAKRTREIMREDRFSVPLTVDVTYGPDLHRQEEAA